VNGRICRGVITVVRCFENSPKTLGSQNLLFHRGDLRAFHESEQFPAVKLIHWGLRAIGGRCGLPVDSRRAELPSATSAGRRAVLPRRSEFLCEQEVEALETTNCDNKAQQTDSEAPAPAGIELLKSRRKLHRQY